MGRVLIVGGYGAFGARAAERLAREPGFDIVIAGRSADKARIHAEALQEPARKPALGTPRSMRPPPAPRRYGRWRRRW